MALVVQTCLLQSLLDGLADNTAVFGGLHALDGLLIAASAGVQYLAARRRIMREEPMTAGHDARAGTRRPEAVASPAWSRALSTGSWAGSGLVVRAPSWPYVWTWL